MSQEHAPQRDETGRDILVELEEEVARELAEERPPHGGPGYQVVGALVTIALGVGGAVLALGYGLGSLERPGPGLWPFAVSVVIAVLGVVLLVGGRHGEDTEEFTRSSLVPAVAVVTFVALGALMPLIGFEIPALLLCAVWLRLLGGESWRSTVLVSVGAVAVFYVLFIYGLRVPLPHLI
ncbi:tripartite tricarboxylate transporter TctB family protein [Cellulosimicrobium cellulans]|uniref:tripartite tricarboxylate transporter TctB family protein n=1 Tax=Cellulosimicrobium cellulans TaxID=1710 RepID=UPI0009F1AE6F|nr:tripartite tricarboxylate transporter TctB family protein [Cellulosimicrobium cellulans]